MRSSGSTGDEAQIDNQQDSREYPADSAVERGLKI
jgi:hypothetical protein